jgi:hypothetical protein
MTKDKDKDKGQFCKLIECFLPKLLKMINDTNKDRLERSVSFCLKGSNVTLSDTITGTTHGTLANTNTSTICKDGKSPIGGFHTHNSGYTTIMHKSNKDLSGQDISSAIINDRKVTCIGISGYGGENKEIICYDYPFGIHKDIADKYGKESRDYMKDLEKYTTVINGKNVPIKNITKQQLEDLESKSNSIGDQMIKIKKYSYGSKSKTERFANSCSISFE